MIKAH